MKSKVGGMRSFDYRAVCFIRHTRDFMRLANRTLTLTLDREWKKEKTTECESTPNPILVFRYDIQYGRPLQVAVPGRDGADPQAERRKANSWPLFRAG